ncbi:MAG: translation elongation factor 4 [Planctomycetota bacterium]
MHAEAVRNFSIIAHIDHGKSTLADRLIERTQAVSDRAMKNQLLDDMDIERERGITIKSHAITLDYVAPDGRKFTLNLIDTPGHADFTYEVSRSLKACEGVLLLIDASQGVQAQTVSNLYLALEQELEIIPVINKIDMPAADPDRVLDQIESELGLDAADAVLASAKTGEGLEDVLEAIVDRIPPPESEPETPLKALVFDSQYDEFRGAVVHLRVFEGTVKPGDEVRLFSRRRSYRVEEVGYFRMARVPTKKLVAGDVGYVIAGIKTVADARVGDTLTHEDRPADAPLEGYRDAQPVVFSSLYPVAADDYEELTEALEKLKLNDASLVYEKDSSTSLGFGFRCGFLGLLHLEVVQERIEREFGLSLITTAPTVKYRVQKSDGETVVIDNPLNFPDPSQIKVTEEPYIRAEIICPERYLGQVIALCIANRGQNQKMHYVDPRNVELRYDLPLAEILFEFYDQLKSVSQGYASFSYEPSRYEPSELVKVDILVNKERVDALSFITHRDRCETRGRQIVKQLKKTISRHLFVVPLQAAIGSKIIARETISAMRKDVTAKCYGGDISRKRKLLEKQKKGKKRMKMVGAVEIPQAAFLAVLKAGKDEG